MLKQITYPDNYSFVGNPMIVSFMGDSAEEVVFEVRMKEQTIIELSVVLFGNGDEYKASINIAKYLVPFFRKISYDESNIVAPLEDFCIEYTIYIKNYPTEIFKSYNGKAFYGGISDSNYALLKSRNMNMFSYRLRNYERQFLFTTRTNSSNLVLRESELYPFVFLHPGKSITILTSSGKILVPQTYPEDTLCILDVEAIRKAIYQVHNELSSFYAILVDDLTIFEIAIIPNQISEESYRIRFKNSLGAYEVIEITGKATDQTLFSEETTWMGYTPFNFFEEKRSRVPSKKGLLASSGYKTKEELAFIVDMIKSDEIYFTDTSDPQNREYRCHVTPDEIKVPRQITEPQSIALKIRLVTEDLFESPDIVMDYPTRILQNITAPGSPEIYGDGLIYAEDFPFYVE